MTNEQTDALITALKNVVAAIEALSAKVDKVVEKVEKVGQAVVANGFETRTALNAILDLVGENNELLRGECAAREKLAKRREQSKECMRKLRASVSKHDKVKGEENEMRDLPPRPPIESKEKEEENSLSTRACEGESKTEEPGTEKKSKKPFVKPTIEEVAAYIKEKGYHFSAEAYWHFYESKDWMVGSNKMSKWRSACKTFEMKHLEDEKRRQRFTPSRKPQTNIVLAPTEAELASARDAI